MFETRGFDNINTAGGSWDLPTARSVRGSSPGVSPGWPSGAGLPRGPRDPLAASSGVFGEQTVASGIRSWTCYIVGLVELGD
jgi:hypothetical protein